MHLVPRKRIRAARKGGTNYSADLWQPSPLKVLCVKSIRKENTKRDPPATLVGRSSQRRTGRSRPPRGKLAVVSTSQGGRESFRPLSGLSALLSGLRTLRKGRAS